MTLLARLPAEPHALAAAMLCCLVVSLAVLGAGGRGDRPEGGALRGLAVFVGSYTDSSNRGIHRFELDPVSGAATQPVVVGVTRNPSFLAWHPNGRVLYAVNEVGDFEGGRTGAVTAFAVDEGTGGLRGLGHQPTGGVDPCHLVVDAAARHLLVANYTSGSVAVLPLDGEGRLRPPSTVVQHAGRGPNQARQEGPHAHAVVLDGQERFALVADLGLDKVLVYRYASGEGTLVPNDPAAVALEPGSGPRHLAWHPNGRYAYLVEELASSVAVLRYDADRGTLERTQAIGMLPPGFAGRNTAAGIAIAANGRFLYASNRGHDSLALFRVDPVNGTLTADGHVPAGGRTPRHFGLDPSGRWLLVANQDSDAITVFRVDPATGRPTPVGPPISIPKPVCVLFAGAGSR
jgi:6-phosphogluconolactonase